MLRDIMKIETIKMYKGSKDVIVNKFDVAEWRGYGYETSSDRQNKQKKKASKKESE